MRQAERERWRAAVLEAVDRGLDEQIAMEKAGHSFEHDGGKAHLADFVADALEKDRRVRVVVRHPIKKASSSG